MPHSPSRRYRERSGRRPDRAGRRKPPGAADRVVAPPTIRGREPNWSAGGDSLRWSSPARSPSWPRARCWPLQPWGCPSRGIAAGVVGALPEALLYAVAGDIATSYATGAIVFVAVIVLAAAAWATSARIEKAQRPAGGDPGRIGRQSVVRICLGRQNGGECECRQRERFRAPGRLSFRTRRQPVCVD